jgi:hypothetical protein
MCKSCVNAVRGSCILLMKAGNTQQHRSCVQIFLTHDPLQVVWCVTQHTLHIVRLAPLLLQMQTALQLSCVNSLRTISILF